MRCTEVQQLVLEADTDELLGDGMSPAAVHLSQCPDCWEVAERLRTQHDAVAAAYLSAAPRRTVDVGEVVVVTKVESFSRKRLRRWALVGLSTAAAAVLVVMARREAVKPATVTPSSPDLPPPPAVVGVAPHQNAIVFPTRDPLISVVWIY